MSQQINLFNPIFLKQKKYFSAVTMAQALALIFVGSAVLWGYGKYRLTALAEEAESASAQLKIVQAKYNKISVDYAPKKKSASLEQEIQKAEFEVSALNEIFAVMRKGDFGNTSGYAEHMRAFSRQIVSGVWLTGFGIQGAGADVSLQGRALKAELIPAYLEHLKRERVLQGKSFAVFEVQTPLVSHSARADAPTASGYIDFSLQSSGTSKDQQVARDSKPEPFAASKAYLDFARAVASQQEQENASGAKRK
jgi:hypothetical protein